MKQVLVVLFILEFFLSHAQEKEISYFQQDVDYKISVELNTSDYTLNAYQNLRYTNNSTQTLDTLYFHIWPNAYKNLETGYANEKAVFKDKDYFDNQAYYQGSMESLNFKVNKKEIQFYLHPLHNDIAVLVLNQSLAPRVSINISTPFIVYIPNSSSRLGHGKTSVQISQWYPKPAVFDNKGWHYFPYRDMGEFYSEFGSYEVDITLPNDYTLASTGNLKKTIQSQLKTTYTYQEDNIHDFAWFADTGLVEKTDSVQLPNTKKWVKTMSYFYPKDTLWINSNTYIKDALNYYSEWLGDYPYKTCKAIQSEMRVGGGMEYPTITVIGTGFNAEELEKVIVHEVGHNWFYGILGFNEREFPWMDEGLNSAYESRYLETKYPDKMNQILTMKYKSRFEDFFSYQFFAARNMDQASNLASEKYNMTNYGAIVYQKNAALFNYLRHYIGDKKFDRIMKLFYEKWKFKHPQPEDLIEIFTENSEKDFLWLFDDLLSSRKKMDYKIQSLKNKNDTSQLRISNTKKIKSPVFIECYQNDSLVKEIISDGFLGDSVFSLPYHFNKVYIDRDIRSLDINRKNNFIKSKGIFKKSDGLNIRFLGGLEKPDKTQLFIAPVLGYNTHNKTMLGLALHSNLIFPPQFEYLIMPLYSFEGYNISGESSFEYHIGKPSNFVKEISPFLSSKTYGFTRDDNYIQVKTGVNLEFNDFLAPKSTQHKLKAYYSLSYDYYGNFRKNHYLNIDYSAQNNKWYNPFKVVGKFTIHKDFALLSIDLKKELTYSEANTGLKIRFFSGVFLFNESNNGRYNLSLSGTHGTNDFLYENTFVGRNESYESFWAHQFIANEGGFATYAPFGSNKWMSSITFSTTLPFKTPFELYFTAAIFEGSNLTFNKGIAWESGLKVNLIRDFLIIYFPLEVEQKINKTNLLYTERYIERIRFTLLLNQLNIRKLSRKINNYL